MADLALIALTVVFFAAVALVARRADRPVPLAGVEGVRRPARQTFHTDGADRPSAPVADRPAAPTAARPEDRS